jgi:hypothetical protein
MTEAKYKEEGKMEERRKAKRHANELIKVKLEEEIFNVVKNISNTGALIMSSKPFNEKTNIKLEFSSKEFKIPLEGMVTRCEKSNDGKFGVGIRFVNLNDQSKAIRDDLLLSLLYQKHSIAWTS